MPIHGIAARAQATRREALDAALLPILEDALAPITAREIAFRAGLYSHDPRHIGQALARLGRAGRVHVAGKTREGGRDLLTYEVSP
jgi:hypothetical protein